MSLFSSDNELGNMLQQAVKLKSHQMSEKRRTYEKWPFFVQHTIYHGEKEHFKAWRQLPFAEKLEVAEKLKEDGNQLYAAGRWQEAIERYEEAPTMLYYCYSTDPGWRHNNRGIDDDVIVLVDDHGESEEDAAKQNKIRLSCALNIAACKQKLAEWDKVIQACDAALELDANSVKALYRRAEARIRPAQATGYDSDLAIKDLAKAYDLDPGNPQVEKLLVQLRAERKVQKGKDQQTFTGLFDRGQIYDKAAEALAAAPPPEEPADPRFTNIMERIDNISDQDPLEKRVADAELLRDLYMKNGKEAEARELHEKIKGAKEAMKKRSKQRDWDNPSEEMIKDAQKYGLDITDPQVIQELKRLEVEGPGLEPSEDFPLEKDSFGLPKIDWSKSIPWSRYVAVFFALFLFWSVVDAGGISPLVESLPAGPGFPRWLLSEDADSDAASSVPRLGNLWQLFSFGASDETEL